MSGQKNSHRKPETSVIRRSSYEQQSRRNQTPKTYKINSPELSQQQILLYIGLCTLLLGVSGSYYTSNHTNDSSDASHSSMETALTATFLHHVNSSIVPSIVTASSTPTPSINGLFNPQKSPEQEISKVPMAPVPLKDLIKKVSISFPKDQRHYLANVSKEWVDLIKEFKQKIRNLIPQVLSDDYLRIILENMDFSIDVIVDQGLLGGGQAGYFHSKRKILILLDTDYSDNMLLQILRNEFYHLFIHTLNSFVVKTQPTSKSFLPIQPFLDNHGKLDDNKFQLHRQTLQLGLERIKQVKIWLRKPKSQLLATENKELSQYLDVMRYYIPCETRTELNQQQYRSLVPHGQKSLKEYAVPDEFNVFFHKFILRDNQYVGFFTFAASEKPKDKLLALIRFVETELNNSNYQHLSPEQLDTEKSSFLFEIDSRVLNVIFKEWYEYHNDYIQNKIAIQNLDTSSVKYPSN